VERGSGGEIIRGGRHLLRFLLVLLSDAETEFFMLLIKFVVFEEVGACWNKSSVWRRDLSCRIAVIYCHCFINIRDSLRGRQLVLALLLLVGQWVLSINSNVLLELSSLDASLEALVEAVLDLVVVSAWEVLEHLSPFRTDLLVELN